MKICRWFIFPPIVLCTAVSCDQGEEQKRANEATAKAVEFFETISQPSSKTRSVWGMSDFTVFGNRWVDGAPEATKTSDNPKEYNVTIPFWCKGKTFERKSVNVRRKLEVQVAATATGSDWEVRTHKFLKDEPLTFLRQSLSWLAVCYLGPIFLSFFLCLFLDQKVARPLTGIATLPLVGYASYLCFGSGWAVCLGLVVYIILTSMLMVLGAAAAAKAQNA